jgi:cell wall assembly regulator SMI1
MSELKDELEYILDWLESLNPEMADCYNPGVSRQQIDEIIKDLPFKLSEEVYELYQWRNGFDLDNNLTSNIFLFPEQLRSDTPITFLSLQYSVSNYHDLCQVSREMLGSNYEFWNPKWFPFAAFENQTMLYVTGDIEPSPVYLCDIGSRPKQVRIYKSLTSMVSVIAECCKSELYQLMPYEYGAEDTMIIRINEDKLELEKEIYRKYNS